MHVYAGSLSDDPQLGFIHVVQEGEDETKTGRRYPTPQRTGAVKITAVESLLFKLQSADGATFTFDLTSRTFSANP